jgi:HK97 family phage portal protein
MSLFKRAAGTAKRFYAPSGGGDPWSIPTNGSLAAYTASGIPVTDDTAMQLLAVASSVRLLSDAVSGLPFDAVKADGEIRKTIEPPPVIIADPFGGSTSTAMATRRQGFSQLMVSLLLRGNAYCAVVARDSRDRPVRLRVLHPDRIDCQFDADGLRTYKVDRITVPAGDIVHIMGMGFPESPTGISVISYARQAIGLGLAAEEFGARFFGEGAHMTGVVEVDADLDAARARQLKENFTASHGGLKNSHTVGVLSGGAKWKPISISPEDAQFLGTRAAQNMDIAMLFGIPPHMLGQTDKTTSWGTGIEQQGLGFLAYTLSAWLGRFEDAWSAMLPKPQSARFNADALLRTDTAGRYAVYSAARSAGILTTNEIRALENYAPIDGGDDIAAPLNSSAPALTKDNGASPSAQKSDALGAVL